VESAAEQGIKWASEALAAGEKARMKHVTTPFDFD
jgi:hypothetical protein